MTARTTAAAAAHWTWTDLKQRSDGRAGVEAGHILDARLVCTLREFGGGFDAAKPLHARVKHFINSDDNVQELPEAAQRQRRDWVTHILDKGLMGQVCSGSGGGGDIAWGELLYPHTSMCWDDLLAMLGQQADAMRGLIEHAGLRGEGAAGAAALELEQCLSRLDDALVAWLRQQVGQQQQQEQEQGLQQQQQQQEQARQQQQQESRRGTSSSGSKTPTPQRVDAGVKSG
ncbi:hypothetical protein FOA52_012590 [Chlamydomonas sp. UWO 241]|nr:hypothetical protein FOA52_012590 [Chlamydomonas sp. UWO 241]